MEPEKGAIEALPAMNDIVALCEHIHSVLIALDNDRCESGSWWKCFRYLLGMRVAWMHRRPVALKAPLI